MREYGQLVDMVRKYQRLGDKDACKHAVEECIRLRILAEYLKKKGRKEKLKELVQKKLAKGNSRKYSGDL